MATSWSLCLITHTLKGRLKRFWPQRQILFIENNLSISAGRFTPNIRLFSLKTNRRQRLSSFHDTATGPVR